MKVKPEGVPPMAERPKCVYCGRRLRPLYDLRLMFPTDGSKGRKVFNGRWGAYYGLFDTHACAGRFAEAAYRAGYRIKS